MGRPSKFTEKLAAEICQRLSAGESLRAICKDEHMPSDFAVRQWAIGDVNGFSSRYARARDLGYDAIAEEALEIANTPREGIEIEDTEAGRKVKRADMLGHRRLQVDTRLKLLAKWDPRRYGDRTAIEHSGKVGLESLISGSNDETS